MSSQHDFDVLVVGAGIAGSSAAYYCSKSNQRVLLLEQFEFLHGKGSSHGNSRIYRKTYPVPLYIKLAEKSLRMWRDIEKECSETLLTQTGLLDFGPNDDSNLLATIAACKQAKVRHEVLNAEQLRNKFPNMNFDDNTLGVFHEEAGILNASKCCHVFQQLAAKRGAILRDNEKVTNIQQSSDQNGYNFTISTSKNSIYKCKKLVLCPGGWAPDIFKMVGLGKISQHFHVCQQTYSFWKVDQSRVGQYQAGKMPVFISFGEKYFYGFPIFEKEGCFKASRHMVSTSIHPDNRSFKPESAIIEEVRPFIMKTFQGVTTDIPQYADTCLYTITPDENFILDRHPANPNIAIFAGGSGHGFKFGPVLGEILCNLISCNELSKQEFDITILGLDRFMSEKARLMGPGMLVKNETKTPCVETVHLKRSKL